MFMKCNHLMHMYKIKWHKVIVKYCQFIKNFYYKNASSEKSTWILLNRSINWNEHLKRNDKKKQSFCALIKPKWWWLQAIFAFAKTKHRNSLITITIFRWTVIKIHTFSPVAFFHFVCRTIQYCWGMSWMWGKKCKYFSTKKTWSAAVLWLNRNGPPSTRCVSIFFSFQRISLN